MGRRSPPAEGFNVQNELQADAHVSDGASSTSTASPQEPLEPCSPRPLLDDERERAWRAANFFAATPNHLQPLALWLVGPSSVGKTTLAQLAGRRYGIPPLACECPTDQSADHSLDAVFVDGEFMRDEHAVWNHLIQTEDWRSAYPLLKQTINDEKDKMAAKATELRKHLIIPHTCLRVDKSVSELRGLAQAGYRNHVVAVLAPLEECQRRGRARELTTGKRYQPLEFESSLSAILPMIEACDGRFEVLQAHEEMCMPGERPSMFFTALLAGNGGSCTEALGAAAGDARDPSYDGADRMLEPEVKAKIQREVARYLSDGIGALP